MHPTDEPQDSPQNQHSEPEWQPRGADDSERHTEPGAGVALRRPRIKTLLIVTSVAVAGLVGIGIGIAVGSSQQSTSQDTGENGSGQPIGTGEQGPTIETGNGLLISGKSEAELEAAFTIPDSVAPEDIPAALVNVENVLNSAGMNETDVPAGNWDPKDPKLEALATKIMAAQAAALGFDKPTDVQISREATRLYWFGLTTLQQELYPGSKPFSITDTLSDGSATDLGDGKYSFSVTMVQVDNALENSAQQVEGDDASKPHNIVSELEGNKEGGKWHLSIVSNQTLD